MPLLVHLQISYLLSLLFFRTLTSPHFSTLPLSLVRDTLMDYNLLFLRMGWSPLILYSTVIQTVPTNCWKLALEVKSIYYCGFKLYLSETLDFN